MTAKTRDHVDAKAKHKRKSSDSEQKFWDRMAEGYSKQPIKDVPSYEKKLEVTRRYLRPDMKLVEIGCGTGGTSILHAPYVESVHATDISADMIEIARKKAEEEGAENVTFERASVEELSQEKESVDAVLALSVLHVLEDREGAIRKVHRMLKPEGLFVTSTVCASDMGATTKFFVNSFFRAGQFFGLLPKFCAFTKTELEDSFKKNGFDIEYEWRPSADKAAFIVAKKKD